MRFAALAAFSLSSTPLSAHRASAQLCQACLQPLGAGNLLAGFGLPLVSPLLALGTTSNGGLPACCRRLTIGSDSKIPRSLASTLFFSLITIIPPSCQFLSGLSLPSRQVFLFRFSQWVSAPGLARRQAVPRSGQTQAGPFTNSYPTKDLPKTGIYVKTYKQPTPLGDLRLTRMTQFRYSFFTP